jgi:hypothetical protein
MKSGSGGVIDAAVSTVTTMIIAGNVFPGVKKQMEAL